MLKKTNLRQVLPYVVLGFLLVASLVSATLKLTDNRIVYNESPLVQISYNATSGVLEFSGNASFDRIKHYGETASYIVFKEGNIVYCKNGTNGLIEYSSSNASDAIQYAINHTTGKVFIKSGEYTLSSTVVQYENVEVIGEGIDKTVIKASTTLNPVWQLYGNNTVLKEITLDGNKQATTVLDVYRANSGDSDIYNIRIDGCKIRGIKNDTTGWILVAWDREQAWKLHDIYISNCIIEDYSPFNTEHDNVAFSYVDGVYIDNTVFRNLGRVVSFYYSENAIWNNLIFLNISNYASLVIQGKNFVGSNILIKNSTTVRIRRCSSSSIETKNIYLQLISMNSTSEGITIEDDASYKVENVEIDAIIDAPYSWGISIGTDTGIGVENVEIDANILNGRISGIVIGKSANKTKIAGYIIDCNTGGGSWASLRNSGTNTILSNMIILNDGTNRCIKQLDGNILLWEGGKIDGIIEITGGSIDKIKNVEGFITESSGSATISAGSTSVTVNHGLAGTPDVVSVTPSGNLTVWVDSLTSTQFTIHCYPAPGSDTTVYWTAEYKP